MERRSPRPRGIALPLVLAALACLIAIAIPFSLSMRHEQSTAAWRVDRDRAWREAMFLQQLAAAHLAKGAPGSPEEATPHADAPGETTLDWEAAAADFGMEDLGPRGRLWSVEAEDLSGRVDLNAAPLPVVARCLGLSSPLVRDLKPDDEELRVADGSRFPDQGFVWISGEVAYYGRRDGGTLYNVTRPAVVPGIWEPEALRLEPREFQAGEEVIDFRAYLVATHVFRAEPGRESRYDTVDQVRSVARYGLGALDDDQVERLHRLCTVYAPDHLRRRWVDPQRVLGPLVDGETRSLRVDSGQYYGPGTLVRVTTLEGEEDHGVVAFVRREENSFRLVLDASLGLDADARGAMVESLYRRPVNVNTCAPELLALLLEGLPRPTADPFLDADRARELAARIVAARPLDGPRGLDALLDALVDSDELDASLARAVYRNAYHAGDFELAGTLPFSYAMAGTYDVRTAASLNFDSGKEKARSFVHEVVSVGGAGLSQYLFGTQRDFEEPWRLTRRARGWTTDPENLQLLSPAELWSDPPGRVAGETYLALNRFASEDPMADTGARLAPARPTGFVVGESVTDVTVHFDYGEAASDDVEGWVMDGTLPPPFATDGGGGDPRAANSQGLGTPDMVDVMSDRTGRSLLQPFAVSLWWNPGPSLAPSFLFDWGRDPLRDRVSLRFDGRELFFEVLDSSAYDAGSFPDGTPREDLIAAIHYAFDDGLELQADTWYHVTAFCRGNRSSQMLLLVDHRSRGERRFATRLSSAASEGFPAGADLLAGSLTVESTEGFPPRGVLRVGWELVEYGEIRGNTFWLDSADRLDTASSFGGRAARGTDELPSDARTHPATTSVELYGYAAPLASARLATGDFQLGAPLGRFYVAMLDPKKVKDPIEVPLTPGPGSIALGTGVEADTTPTLPLAALSPSEQVPSDAFQRDGGYALLLTFDPDDDDTVPGGGNNTARLFQTVKGSIIGGAEVIRYAGFQGSELTGVVRGHQLRGSQIPPNFGGQGQGRGGGGNLPSLLTSPHAFLVNNDYWTGGGAGGTAPPPKTFPVLVVPISLKTGVATLSRFFPIPENAERCELAQVGLDFENEDQDATEWIRYNSIVDDFFVRDDLEAVQSVIDYLQIEQGRLILWTSLIFDIGRAYDNGLDTFGGQGRDDFFDEVNFEDLDDPGSNRLAFRGVLGTENCTHAQTARVLPVFRVLCRGYDDLRVRPGRWDEVTLVDPDSRFYDPGVINHAWNGRAEDWSRSFAHVALRQAVSRELRRTERLDFTNEDEVTTILANYAYTAESRDFVRLLKFPSGELPADAVERFRVGSDLSGGTGSSGAIVDEVRVMSAGDPHPLVTQGMLLLEEDLTEQSESAIDLREAALQFPHRAVRDDVTEALQPLATLPEDAFVLQIGDELVACDRRQITGSANAQIATDGRGVLGTEPGFHHRDEPAMLVPFFVVSRLVNGISPDDSEVRVADAQGFPRSGFVQIDREILGYGFVQGVTDGGAAALTVPTYFGAADDRDDRVGKAAFRGRFGTESASHDQDALVFWFPERYPDWYAPRAEFPELGCLEIDVPARRGWFHSVTWSEHSDDGLVHLVAQARVLGHGGFAGDPEEDPDLFFFEEPGDQGRAHVLDRQGDELLLRFFTEYEDGAADPDAMLSSAWKRTPTLQTLGVEYVAVPVVETHEELP